MTNLNVELGAVLKGIVKEALREVLAETHLGYGAQIATMTKDAKDVKGDLPKEAKELNKEVVKNEFAGKVAGSIAEDVNPHADAQDAVNKAERRAELEALTYNQVKSIATKAGLDKSGNKAVLVERILEAEFNGAQEEVAPQSDEKVTRIESDPTPVEKEEVSDEDNSEDGEEYDEADFREFLEDLEVDELKDIAKEAGVKLTAKDKTAKAITNKLVADLDKLVEALTALGYYDDEESNEADAETTVDEVDNTDTEDGDNEPDNIADEYGLNDMSVEELAEICTDNGLSAKGKKQALIDRIVKGIEDGVIEFEDDEETQPAVNVDDNSEDGADEEWYTEEELMEYETSDLEEIATENELEIPTKKVKGKTVTDRKALIQALVALGEGEESEEGNVPEDNKNESEDTTEGSEDYPEREAKENEIEEEIQAQYKAKKLKDSVIKKFLEKYNEGNPDCKGCKGCSKEEILDCYITAKQSLVDDEGDVMELEEAYIRNGEYHCCGKELKTLDDDLYCSVCGQKYEQ